jgi:hypothetical protein
MFQDLDKFINFFNEINKCVINIYIYTWRFIRIKVADTEKKEPCVLRKKDIISQKLAELKVELMILAKIVG